MMLVVVVMVLVLVLVGDGGGDHEGDVDRKLHIRGAVIVKCLLT